LLVISKLLGQQTRGSFTTGPPLEAEEKPERLFDPLGKDLFCQDVAGHTLADLCKGWVGVDRGGQG
jgi:hypothetical protein